MVRRRREEERLSDPGEDAPSTGGRLLVGCGVGLVLVVLVAGAVGIGVGARRRFASPDDQAAPTSAAVDPSEPSDPSLGPPIAPVAPRLDPRDDPRAQMERRYRAGPYVQVESMVPSGRLLPDLPAGLPTRPRTVDTPWVVVGADLLPGPPPPGVAGAPRVDNDPADRPDRPLTVLARTPARAGVRARDASGGTDVVEYIVAFDDYRGHFRLPATIETELGMVQAGGSDGATIYFLAQSAILSDGRSLRSGESFPVTMRIAGVDSAGRVSAYVTRPLELRGVGAGDVEVTLTMGEATDLDLYVTDPAGVQIYFGNERSFSGGQLDLDANAACSRNLGVDNEHVFWPEHAAPAGTYRVHVAYYQSCISGRPVAYRVTVRACGETTVLTGRFDGGARGEVCQRPSPGDRGWCQEVVQFDIPPCATM